jgi:DNA polymerase I-like protein with 3'-5' exonuclease and polymerase domains
MSTDLSSAELEILKQFSGETGFDKAEGDLHSYIATNVWREIWHIRKDFGKSGFIVNKTINSDLRQQSKSGVTFPVFYGARAKRVAKALNVKYEEAKAVIKLYYYLFPKAMKYLDNASQTVLWTGMLRTNPRTNSIIWYPYILETIKQAKISYEILKRQRAPQEALNNARYTPEKLDWRLLKVSEDARNYSISAVQADMLKEITLELALGHKQQNTGCKIVGVIHDEVITAVAPEYSKLKTNNPKQMEFKPDLGNKLNSGIPELLTIDKWTEKIMTKVCLRYGVNIGASSSIEPYWHKS